MVNAVGYELVGAEAKKGARSANPDVTDLAMQGWTSLWRSFQQPPTERRETNRRARGPCSNARSKLTPKTPELPRRERNFTYYADFIYGWGDPGTDYMRAQGAQAS